MDEACILIVDDNADNLELMRFLLARAGLQVQTALSGQEGIEVARRQRPGVILLDLAMPDMDGWSVARALKADPQTSSIPIVAVTAFTLPGDRHKALEAGCNGYIAKPLNVASFAQEVSSYLEGKPYSPGDLVSKKKTV